jgi:hypothetical protein
VLNERKLDLLDAWIRSLLWEGEVPFPPQSQVEEGTEEKKPSELDIHRLKGKLAMEGGKQQLIQGVREVFEIFDGPNQEGLGLVEGKLVLIGRGLKSVDLKGSLDWFISQG